MKIKTKTKKHITYSVVCCRHLKFLQEKGALTKKSFCYRQEKTRSVGFQENQKGAVYQFYLKLFIFCKPYLFDSLFQCILLHMYSCIH